MAQAIHRALGPLAAFCGTCSLVLFLIAVFAAGWFHRG